MKATGERAKPAAFGAGWTARQHHPGSIHVGRKMGKERRDRTVLYSHVMTTTTTSLSQLERFFVEERGFLIICRLMHLILNPWTTSSIYYVESKISSSVPRWRLATPNRRVFDCASTEIWHWATSADPVEEANQGRAVLDLGVCSSTRP